MFVSPAVAGDLVYVGSCSGTYFALDRATGATRWTYDTRRDGEAAQFHGNPLITAALVVTGSDGQGAGLVYAFDRKTGELRGPVLYMGSLRGLLSAYEIAPWLARSPRIKDQS